MNLFPLQVISLRGWLHSDEALQNFIRHNRIGKAFGGSNCLESFRSTAVRHQNLLQDQTPEIQHASKVAIMLLCHERKVFSRIILSAEEIKKKFLLFSHCRSSRNPVEEAYREAAILRRLEHPNVIKLFEVIDEPDEENMYLVLELMEHPIVEVPAGWLQKLFLHIFCFCAVLNEQLMSFIIS